MKKRLIFLAMWIAFFPLLSVFFIIMIFVGGLIVLVEFMVTGKSDYSEGMSDDFGDIFKSDRYSYPNYRL